jgi:hypothetical protein
MENKVIQLPKVLNWQKQWRDHFHERKASVAVSIASILVFSLFLNQWLISPSLTMAGAGQRGIASVGLSAEDYKNTVKWEHELADQVAGSRRNVAHLSEKPNLRDELLFGALGGRYGVQFEQGKVLSIEFNASKANGNAMIIADREKFIKDYRGVWALDFADAEFESKTEHQEIYKLLGPDRSEKGRAMLDLDQDGHFIGLKIIK